MNYIEYPVVGVSPVGLIRWKNLRVSQLPEAKWSTIETAAGVYNASALANFDSIVTFQRQNGASIYFGLYSTPTFYASAVANPTYGDSVTKGPWNNLGEGANPTSLPAVANFVTMIINRYNKPGGAWYDANGATLGKGIQYWETWNEPGMDLLGNANVTGANGPCGAGRFFWGTPAQMIDVAQTQYAAIKATDSSIVVTTPGFSGFSTTVANAFLTTVGASTSKTGVQSCDAFAWHPYFMTPPGVSYGAWTTGDIIFGTWGVRVVKDWLASNGYSLPLWISEWGVDAGSATTTEIAWYAEAPSFRYTWIARFLMSCAAMGVKTVCPFHWKENGVVGHSGNWQQDTLGVQKAYNDVSANVVGKTITSSSYIPNGAVTLNFSDGSSWTV